MVGPADCLGTAVTEAVEATAALVAAPVVARVLEDVSAVLAAAGSAEGALAEVGPLAAADGAPAAEVVEEEKTAELSHQWLLLADRMLLS